MRIVAIALQKGGVAKTTTVVSVGVGLARQGKRVLLVDLDPQANMTRSLGVDPAQLEETQASTAYEVLLNPEVPADHAVVEAFGLHLIPASPALAGAERDLTDEGRELRLRDALAPLRGRYDYILIDSPPSLGVFTLNALAAADGVLVPMQLQGFAYHAMDQLESTIDLVRTINPVLQLDGIACTMTSRTILSRSVEQTVRTKYGPLVLDATIPQNTRIAEAMTKGVPIFDYDAGGAGALAYEALTDELRARYEAPQASAAAVANV